LEYSNATSFLNFFPERKYMVTYTFEELCAMENIADRLSSSVRTFANANDRSTIDEMLLMIRRIRSVANCNKKSTVDLDNLKE